MSHPANALLVTSDAGLALTQAEQRALVAFLRTLTDSSVTVAPGDTSLTTDP